MTALKIHDLVPGNGDMAVIIRNDGNTFACVRHGDDVINLPVRAKVGRTGSLQLPIRLQVVAGFDDHDWLVARRGSADEIAEPGEDV